MKKEKFTYHACFLIFRFCIVGLLSFILFGCLDIPTKPNTSAKIERINVYVEQVNSKDSTLLKINPNDSAKLHVDVYPRQYKNDLSFEWYIDENVLGKESSYKIKKNIKNDSIPNKVSVTDSEGNRREISFSIIQNTPPSIDSDAIPASGDTLYGNSKTAFLFQWNTNDEDYQKGDRISHTLIIDDKAYSVGALESIRQSGFTEGKHHFKVIATDSYGDSDTLKTHTFYVLTDTEEK